jgi:hypothetical protein
MYCPLLVHFEVREAAGACLRAVEGHIWSDMPAPGLVETVLHSLLDPTDPVREDAQSRDQWCSIANSFVDMVGKQWDRCRISSSALL